MAKCYLAFSASETIYTASFNSNIHMTFEDFKLHFEMFAKIDTPEKLAICERQYRAHLVAKDDSNFFKPLDVTKAELSSEFDYTKNLYSILGFSQINKDQILFLSQPSFEAEHLLIIEKLGDKYALTQVILEESYWLRYYRDNSISTAKTTVSKGYMKKAVGNRIFALMEQSIGEAKKPQLAIAVMDGTGYKLSKIVDGFRRDVSKNSPAEDSKTGRIIKLLETVIELMIINPTPGAEKEIEHLITQCQ